jgi:hypothetical protein
MTEEELNNLERKIYNRFGMAIITGKSNFLPPGPWGKLGLAILKNDLSCLPKGGNLEKLGIAIIKNDLSYLPRERDLSIDQPGLEKFGIALIKNDLSFLPRNENLRELGIAIIKKDLSFLPSELTTYFKKDLGYDDMIEDEDKNNLNSMTKSQNYNDVIDEIKSGNKLAAVKLLKDKTGWGLKECKDWVDDRNERLTDELSEEDIHHPSYSLNHNIVRDIKIESRKLIIENEIDTLYQSIESFKNEQSLKNEELSSLREALNEKKEALSNAINNVYSRKNIHKSIADFYSLLNSLYYNKFNVKFVEDEGKFKGDFYKKILDQSVESIIKPMSFKHNSGQLKAKGLFNFISISALSSLFFYLAHEFGRTLSFYDGWEYNFLGWILNTCGGFLALGALGALLTLSSLKSEVVISVIQNDENANFKELLNYLNSIHKLPKEIKNLIK